MPIPLSAHSAYMKPGAWGFATGVAPGPNEDADLQRQQWHFQAGQAEAQRGFEGGQAGAQRDFQGQQAAAERANQSSIAALPWNYKDKVFNTVSPLLTGLMGGGGSTIGGGSSGLVGGQNTPLPTISQGPVWTQGQIDQQVNAQKSNNARAAQTQGTQAQQRVAASGFGQNSPLLMALQGQAQATRMGADAAAERETNWNAAQGNAQHTLDTQQAAQNQWAQANQTDIERRKTNNQYVTSLASILAGMM